MQRLVSLPMRSQPGQNGGFQPPIVLGIGKQELIQHRLNKKYFARLCQGFKNPALPVGVSLINIKSYTAPSRYAHEEGHKGNARTWHSNLQPSIRSLHLCVHRGCSVLQHITCWCASQQEMGVSCVTLTLVVLGNTRRDATGF